MQAVQVFTPGKEPEVTYIDDHLTRRAELLADALASGAIVISLSGPSKSGKTVFIEKNIGRDRLVSVTGAGINSAHKLWERVFSIIGTPTTRSVTKTNGSEAALGAKVGGEAGVPLIAKGTAEVNAGYKTTGSTALKEDTPVDDLQLLIRELAGTGFVVFIDDFHYIPPEVQIEVSNQIKEAIRQGVNFVVASVPYHSDDAVRANSDLRGRTLKLDFDYWKPAELAKIAQRGFEALNASASPAYIDALSIEAAGSPQLMQTLCLNTCFENKIKGTVAIAPQHIASDREAIGNVCTRAAATADYSSTVAKMKEGPKTRGTERNSYLTVDGAVIDVYPLILRAISKDPPELTLRYPNLQARIHALCAKEQPSGSSVTGACFHMASIANESEAKNVIEWDGANDVLDIRDPYLLFYLRWGSH